MSNVRKYSREVRERDDRRMTETSDRPQSRGEWQDLLSQRINESGLSVDEWSVQVLRREPRTVRSWLFGDTQVPDVVQDFLVDPKPAPWPSR